MKKILICFMVIVLAVMPACSKVRNEKEDITYTESSEIKNPYIGKTFTAIESELSKQYFIIKKDYEYSYITPKGNVTNIEEISQNEVNVMISLGKPEEEKGTKDKNSFVQSYRDDIYMVDNMHLYKMKDGKFDIYKIFYTLMEPYDFDIDNGIMFYIDDDGGEIYRFNLDDDPNNRVVICDDLSDVDNVLVVNGHVFYYSSDGNIYRITQNGNEKTLMVSYKEPEFDQGFYYSKGFIYFIDENFCLNRIKADGSGKETITSGVAVHQFIDEKGSIIIQTVADEFYRVEGQDLHIIEHIKGKDIVKKYFSSNDGYFYEGYDGTYIIGYEEERLYLFAFSGYADEDYKSYIISYSVNQLDSGSEIVHGYVDLSGYWPTVLGNKVYYYDYDRWALCSVDIDTLETNEVAGWFTKGSSWGA